MYLITITMGQEVYKAFPMIVSRQEAEQRFKKVCDPGSREWYSMGYNLWLLGPDPNSETSLVVIDKLVHQ